MGRFAQMFDIAREVADAGAMPVLTMVAVGVRRGFARLAVTNVLPTSQE